MSDVCSHLSLRFHVLYLGTGSVAAMYQSLVQQLSTDMVIQVGFRLRQTAASPHSNPKPRGGNIMHRCVACCVSCPVSNRHLAGRCGLMLTCQDRTLSAKSSFCDRFSSKIVALLFETAPVVEIWLKPDLSEFGTKPDLMRTPHPTPILVPTPNPQPIINHHLTLTPAQTHASPLACCFCNLGCYLFLTILPILL